MVLSIQMIMLRWHPQSTVFCAVFILVLSLAIVIWITDRYWEKLNGTQELLVSYSRVKSSPIKTRDQFFLLLQSSSVKEKSHLDSFCLRFPSQAGGPVACLPYEAIKGLQVLSVAECYSVSYKDLRHTQCITSARYFVLEWRTSETRFKAGATGENTSLDC